MKKKKFKNRKIYFLQTFFSAVIIFAGFVVLRERFEFLNQGISLGVLGSIYFVSVFMAMKTEMKYTRSWFSVFTNVTVLPVLYALFCAGVLNSKLIKLLLLYVLLFVAIEFWCTSGTMAEKKSEVKRYVFSVLKYDLIFITMVIGVMVLIVSDNARDMLSETMATIMTREVGEMDEEKEDYSIENNIETASKIVKWDSLSDKEKEELLQLYVRMEAEYYGMSSFPNFMVWDLRGNVAGKYSREYDMVYIDSELFSAKDGYNVLFVLAHEMSHRNQHIEVELMQQILVDPDYEGYQNAKIFHDVRSYAGDFENYVTTATGGTYEEYANQTVEIMADSDAQKAVDRYKAYIEEYLKGNT